MSNLCLKLVRLKLTPILAERCANELIVAHMYELGHGVEKDAAKSVEFYELASNQGDMDARCNLGMLN